MNDLYRCTDLFCLLYADDTTLLARDKDIFTLTNKMNKEMEKVIGWFSANKLTLNVAKTKVILFSNKKKQQDTCPDVFLRDNQNKKVKIERVSHSESVRLLGVYFDPGLSFKHFFDKICNRLASSLFVLRKLKNVIDFETLKLIYFAFFHSHLEFASFFLYCTGKGVRKKIEGLQKQAIRTLISLPRLSHTAEAFYALDILPFNYLCEYNILKFMMSLKQGILFESFHADWRTNNEVTGSELRNAHEYYIPILKYEKLKNLPPFVFSRVFNFYNRTLRIEGFSTDKLKDCLIDKAFGDNQCRNNTDCYICNNLKKEKISRIELRKEKELRVKKIIKEKGIQRKERYEKALKKYVVSN